MKILVKILAILALIAVIALLMTFPVMWLWNWLMPDIFGLVEINFWQALGINILSGILIQPTNISD